MKVILCLSIWLLGVTASPLESATPQYVEPEYLDQLLEEKRYDEFSELMDLGDPTLAYPEEGAEPKTRHEAMLHQNLELGDIIVSSKEREQARQGRNFQRYPRNKWQSPVPYTISNKFTANQRETIQRGINRWNEQVSCIKFRLRQAEKDYVDIFPGQGCYARISKAGGQQALSLDPNGCINIQTILHEMEHAIGFAHEHNRSDRDGKVEVLWNNIPERWKGQYKKTNSEEFVLQGAYDCYSIMHYPMNAPGTNKKAFRFHTSGVDESRIGNAKDFTAADLRKICELYK